MSNWDGDISSVLPNNKGHYSEMSFIVMCDHNNDSRSLSWATSSVKNRKSVPNGCLSSRELCGLDLQNVSGSQVNAFIFLVFTRKRHH